MRRRIRPHRAKPSARPLRALLAMLVLLAAAALPAHADDPPQTPPVDQVIRIELPNGAVSPEVKWSTVEGAAQPRRIELPGGAEVMANVVTLEQVLNRAQMTTDRVSSIGLTRDDGSAMTISRLQLTEFYFDPVFYLDDRGVLSLLRPRAIGFPAEVATAIDGVLTMRIGSQPQLTAHPERVAVGQEVSFSVTVPLDVPDPSKITYVWDFNDDRPVVRNDSTEMRRSFAKPGPYNVIVNYEVDGQPWSDQLAPSALVTVTEPTRPSRDRNARKSDRRRADRGDEGGGDDEETTDPYAGAGSGGGAGSGSGSGGYGGSTGGGYTPPVAAATPPPTPRPQPRAPERRAAPPPEPVGETVDGYLLAAADVPLPTGGAVRAASADPAPLDDGPLEIPAAVWVVIGVLGLGVLGWTLESRTTLPYFKP